MHSWGSPFKTATSPASATAAAHNTKPADWRTRLTEPNARQPRPTRTTTRLLIGSDLRRNLTNPAFVGQNGDPSRSQRVRKRLTEPETAGSTAGSTCTSGADHPTPSRPTLARLARWFLPRGTLPRPQATRCSGFRADRAAASAHPTRSHRPSVSAADWLRPATRAVHNLPNGRVKHHEQRHAAPRPLRRHSRDDCSLTLPRWKWQPRRTPTICQDAPRRHGPQVSVNTSDWARLSERSRAIGHDGLRPWAQPASTPSVSQSGSRAKRVAAGEHTIVPSRGGRSGR